MIESLIYWWTILRVIKSTLMQPLQIHQIEKIIINDAKNNATGEMHAKLNTYEKVSLCILLLF